jgi:hypothetical protein
MGDAGSLAVTTSPHKPAVSLLSSMNILHTDHPSTNAISKDSDVRTACGTYTDFVHRHLEFTKDCSRKEIRVIMGGSWIRPPRCWQEVTFSDDEKPDTNVTEKPEWGTGRQAFLWLKVRDTGCGMTHDEQKKLFSRFSQATPRTHVKYGKSKTFNMACNSLTNTRRFRTRSLRLQIPREASRWRHRRVFGKRRRRYFCFLYQHANGAPTS